MEDALDSGASDCNCEGGSGEVVTEPAELSAVREALEAKGYTVESAETEKIPSNYVSLTEEHSEKMGRLLEYLEDNDDVTEVWHNWDEEE